MAPSLEAIADIVRRHPRLVAVDDYELLLRHSESMSKKFINGKEILGANEDDLQIGLRILHRKRPGRSSTTKGTPESMERLVEAAFDASSAASPDPWFRFPLLRTAREPVEDRLRTPQRQIGSLFNHLNSPVDELEEIHAIQKIRVHLVRKGEKLEPKYAKEIHSLGLCIINGRDRSIRFRELRSSSRPVAGLNWPVEDAKEGGRSRSTLQPAAAERNFEIDSKGWLEDLARSACEPRLRLRFILKEHCHFLLAPRVGAALLKRIASWFYANTCLDGLSPLAKTRDQKLFSDALTLVDDGNYPGGSVSAPFDMEGSLTTHTVLVEQGVVRNFLYDTYCATRENRLSTANLSYDKKWFTPRIASTNLYIVPSRKPAVSLVSSINRGVLLDCLDSIEDDTEYKNTVVMIGSGWLVAQGRRTNPLTNIRIKCELGGLFKKVTGVGNDLSFFGPYGSPSILLENLP